VFAIRIIVDQALVVNLTLAKICGSPHVDLSKCRELPLSAMPPLDVRLAIFHRAHTWNRCQEGLLSLVLVVEEDGCLAGTNTQQQQAVDFVFESGCMPLRRSGRSIDPCSPASSSWITSGQNWWLVTVILRKRLQRSWEPQRYRVHVVPVVRLL